MNSTGKYMVYIKKDLRPELEKMAEERGTTETAIIRELAEWTLRHRIAERQKKNPQTS